MGKVRAVCISEKRGTQKKNIESAVFVENWGIEGDAHAGNWHRQISLLSEETIAAFKARGAEVTDGAFGENLVVSGYDFTKFPVGTRFTCKDVVLELTQIGKECHHGCEIFQKMGECIMPTNGVFAKVLHGGKISVGDEFHVQYRAAVITLSDTASKGEREDASGAAVEEIVRKEGYEVVFKKIIPDDGDSLTALLCELSDEDKADLILTTGGTGFPKETIRRRQPCVQLSANTGNLGSHALLFPADHAEGNALQGRVGNPERGVDRQPSGKPEGGKRVSGICDWCTDAWN